MSEVGFVLSWQVDERPVAQFHPQNKGFGFIERESGESIFCHKNDIVDGNSLLPETAVQFDVAPNEKKPGQLRATNVTGGSCFFNGFIEKCEKVGCKFSHERRPKVIKDGPSVDEATAAVAASRTGPPPLLVSTVSECASHCARLAATGVVAVDFEGVNLCRDGELLLAQLAADDGLVVLVDIATLGAAAFDDGGLRALLESDAVLKVVYDGRSDADALYHTCGCRLNNVCDCQVLCSAYLDAQKLGGGGEAPARAATQRLPGLAKALTCCSGLAASDGQALANLKKAVTPLFVPDKGGSYETWRQRPLTAPLIEYAAADVLHLHTLRKTWGSLVSDEQMLAITSARIQRAITADAAAKGSHMSLRDW